MLPCVCSVIDHRWRQNVVRTLVTHSAASRVPLFGSYHILTSSVIYYWTDARQHGIYLLNRYRGRGPVFCRIAHASASTVTEFTDWKQQTRWGVKLVFNYKTSLPCAVLDNNSLKRSIRSELVTATFLMLALWAVCPRRRSLPPLQVEQ